VAKGQGHSSSFRTPSYHLIWATHRGLADIPKINNPERLLQNLEVTDFDIAAEDIDAISGLDRHLRFNNPTDVSLFLLMGNTINVTLANIRIVPRHFAHLCLSKARWI
jgi:hypothetical protein